MYKKLCFLVYLFIQSVICIPKEYNIAVLLENYDHERIFRFAISDINLKKGNNFRLNPLMVSVAPEEPFQTLNNTCNALTKGIIGIFGPTSPSNTYIVQSICNAKDIPHILTHWTEQSNSGTQINLFPQTKQLSNAYMDIIFALNWEEFTLLYTNAQSLLKLNEFIEKAKTAGIVVYVVNVDPDGTGNYRPILRELRKSTQTYFLIDCDVEILDDVLFQIQQIGMLTSNYNYFLTNLDAHTQDLEAYIYSGADITGIQLVNPMSSKIQSISTQLYDDESYGRIPKGWNLDSESALIIDAIHIFSNSLKLLDVNQASNLNCNNSDSWQDGLSVVNKLKSDFYNGLTGDIKFDFAGQRDGFELTIYKIEDSGIIRTGTWDTTQGINIIQKKSEEIEETDVNKGPFVVITTLAEPYSMYKSSPSSLSGNDKYEGFAIDLIHEISKIQGFDYTFVIRKDGQNGIYDPVHGTWTGMIGDILNGNADLAISDMTITSERTEAVDFTVPFMHLGISILSRKPIAVPPGLFHFARPFAADVWRAIAITSVSVVFSLYVVGRLCQSEWQKTSVKSKYVVSQLTLLNTAWFVAGSLFRQSTQAKIRSIPGRIIAATWWLFCFILIAMYISSLISTTVSVDYIADFSDVESLVRNAHERGIAYGAKSGGATEEFFKNSGNPLYQEIYQYMESHPEDMKSSISEGVERAESSNYAFFMESSTIEYETNRRCDLAMYGNLLNERGYGIAVRKGSPYLSALSVSILKLQTSGKLDALKKKWWQDKRGGDRCDVEVNEYVSSMSFGDIAGLIYITIFGIILATFSGILEFSIHTYILSRKFNTSLLQAFRHEFKRCFSGRVKRTIDPTLLSKPTPEDEINGSHEAVELS